MSPFGRSEKGMTAVDMTSDRNQGREKKLELKYLAQAFSRWRRVKRGRHRRCTAFNHRAFGEYSTSVQHMNTTWIWVQPLFIVACPALWHLDQVR